jgi:hypothetical protein
MRNDIELKQFQEKRFEIESGKLYVLKLNADKLTEVDIVFIAGDDIVASMQVLVDIHGIRLPIRALGETIALTNLTDAQVYGYMEELT